MKKNCRGQRCPVMGNAAGNVNICIEIIDADRGNDTFIRFCRLLQIDYTGRKQALREEGWKDAVPCRN